MVRREVSRFTKLTSECGFDSRFRAWELRCFGLGFSDVGLRAVFSWDCWIRVSGALVWDLGFKFKGALVWGFNLHEGERSSCKPEA